jgi:hypothetical protein
MEHFTRMTDKAVATANEARGAFMKENGLKETGIT